MDKEAHPRDPQQGERKGCLTEHVMELRPDARRERPAHMHPIERGENAERLPGRGGEPGQALPAE